MYNKLEFRNDIVGLRAIAVISVIFFHLNYSYFVGGFLGVDIFFVISGFIIPFILEKNDNNFAKQLASFGDFYINDAFSVSHRAHASTQGITNYLPSFAGFLIQDELKALSMALDQPAKPVAALVGGSKISTKIDILNNLSDKIDYLIIGGAMANTFLKAQGYEIGGH